MLGAQAEFAANFADSFHGGGGGAVAGEEDVEVGQVGGFEAGPEGEDLGGGRFGAGDAAVGCVVACWWDESVMRLQPVLILHVEPLGATARIEAHLQKRKLEDEARY
jgi:hypothetical protein